jgi:hypothetical protein
VQKKSLEDRLKKLEEKASVAASIPASFNLSDHLFPQQLSFVQDPAPFKVGLCSRRAGKSTACAADLVYTALTTQQCTALYVTGARTDAKKIVWSEVKRFNDQHGFRGVPNESELAMSFPNGSVVRLAGAKDDASVEKIRGQMPPVKKAYIDEAQSIRDSLLRKLIDDVLEPALLDYNGTLVMIGTPPPVPVGFFVDSSKSSQWSSHKWTFFDNPFIPLKSGRTHQEALDRVLKRRGVTVDDPSIRREFFGELALDTNSLVYQYNPSLNHYDALPSDRYTYMLGVDLGFNDADALAVLAWNENSKITYLVEEVVTREQGVTELVEQIELMRKKYDISKIIMDTGGLGKKISEEIIRRYKIPITAAEKTRKFEYIELFNAAMRTGQFMAKRDSLFALDSMKVEWDRDKTKPDRKVISDRFHSDICEAALYAWRESYSFTHVPAKPKPVYGSKAWAAEEAERLEQEAIEHFERMAQDEKDINNFGWGDGSDPL